MFLCFHHFFYLFYVICTVASCNGRNYGCFHGETQAGAAVGLDIQQCQGLQNQWCAISYSVTTQTTRYFCGSELQTTFGLVPSHCGSGGLAINDGGCQMVNGPTGSCYVCCCVGFQCNNPMLFIKDAGTYFNGAYLYGNSSKPTFMLIILILFSSIFIL